MAANVSPIFTITPHIGMVRISVANTNRDGSGTVNTVISATVNGTRIDRVVITATGSTVASMVRFFIFDGTNYRAWKEVPVTLISASATLPAFNATLTTPDPQTPLLVLPSGYSLVCSTHDAQTFDVVAHAGDF